MKTALRSEAASSAAFEMYLRKVRDRSISLLEWAAAAASC